MRMSRDNPDTECVGAALGGGDEAFVNVMAVAGGMLALLENGDRSRSAMKAGSSGCACRKWRLICASG